MRCKAMIGWLALVLNPMGVAILFAGRGADRRIDQRSRLDPDRLCPELGGDRLEQRLVQSARR